MAAAAAAERTGGTQREETNVSRFNAKIRCNYFPLPMDEGKWIRQLLEFPNEPFSALDPCAGEGQAFVTVTADSQARRYGIELDTYRAEEASGRLLHVIQGNCLETHCPVESLSLIYVNPPYDWTMGGSEERRERLEALFLHHVYRWLVPGGVLLLVIPADQVGDCAPILASQFKLINTFRLSSPESVRYRQVLIAGVRRTKRERDQLKDREITDTRYRFQATRREYERLTAIENYDGARYSVPVTGPANLTFRGLPFDQIEDQLRASAAYRRAIRILAPAPRIVAGRPLTPLHRGHIGLLAVGGSLNGTVGMGEDLHIAAWKSKKVVTKIVEDEDDGTTVIRERERWAHELSLAFASGDVATIE
jgi:hypothetical protein